MRFKALLLNNGIEIAITSIDETNARTKAGVLLKAAERLERAIMRHGSTALLQQIDTAELVETYAEFIRTSLESREGCESERSIIDRRVQPESHMRGMVFADGRERKGLRLVLTAFDDAWIARTDTFVDGIFGKAA